jgi:hypothetical protein
MKFIIFISSRIRNGQPVRHPDFSYSNLLGLYIYQGRLLDAAEFNEAASRVFTEKYLTKGLTFAPRAVVAEVVEVIAPPAEPSAPAEPEPPAEPADEAPQFPAEPEVATDEPAPVIETAVEIPASQIIRVPTRRPKKSAESETS